MSAIILAWPTAATPPVTQRRRGPLPKAVRSLSAYRADREKAREERGAENVAQVKRQFFEAFDRVLRGEVAGVAIIESSCGDRANQVCIAGEFQEDFAYLERVLDKIVDAVPRWAKEREA